jgi:hypothetical protein
MPSFTPDAKVTIAINGFPGLHPVGTATAPMAAFTRLS